MTRSILQSGSTLNPPTIGNVADSQLPVTAQAATLSSTYGRSPRLGIASPSAAERRKTLLPAVMATPPTVTYSATPYGVSSITNGVPVLITDARVRLSGGVLDAGTSGTNGTLYYQAIYTNGNGMFRLEFDTDAPAFELDLMRNANVQVIADGQLIGAAPQTNTVNGAQQYYMRIDFGSRKPRRLVVQVNNQISRVIIGPNDSLWYPTTPRTPRYRLISDSVGQAAAFPFPTGGPYLLSAAMLGWDDTEISAVGGTGFLNPGAGLSTFRQRIAADVLSRSPEVIGIFGGINDQGRQAKPVLQTEITTLVSQCRTSSPGALIIGGGPWAPRTSYATSQNYIDVRDAFLASLQTITGPWIFADPLTGGWTASNGTTGAATTAWITGEGTAQFRTVTDGVTTNASTTVTSATAAFTSSDVARVITGTGIPSGTTISSVTNGTTAVLSAAATATATAVTFNITNQTGSGNADLYIADGTHPNSAGALYAANRLSSAISAALASLGL